MGKFLVFLMLLSINAINGMPSDNICNKYFDTFSLGATGNVLECQEIGIIIESKPVNGKFDEPNLKLIITRKLAGRPILWPLNLQRTDGLLANNNTLVSFGVNEDTYIQYEKSNIETIAPELGEFIMYHDYEARAAFVGRFVGENLILEGFIGNYMVKYDSSGKYILVKTTYPIYGIKTNPCDNCNAIDEHLSINLKSQSSTDVIYPELLIALDWDTVENKTDARIILDVLIYYNAVDMLFSPFNSPKIQLNIAGIIIPKNVYSSPYLYKSQSTSSNDFISYNPIHDSVRRHFIIYKDQFPLDSYDIVMGMSNVQFCDADEQCNYYGVSYQNVVCNDRILQQFGPIVGVIRHPDFQGHYSIATKEIAHMLGGNYVKRWNSACCYGIMNEIDNPLKLSQSPLKWSTCTIRDMSAYFQLNIESIACMHKKPMTSEIITSPLKTITAATSAPTTQTTTTETPAPTTTTTTTTEKSTPTTTTTTEKSTPTTTTTTEIPTPKTTKTTEASTSTATDKPMPAIEESTPTHETPIAKKLFKMMRQLFTDIKQMICHDTA